MHFAGNLQEKITFILLLLTIWERGHWVSLGGGGVFYFCPQAACWLELKIFRMLALDLVGQWNTISLGGVVVVMIREGGIRLTLSPFCWVGMGKGLMGYPHPVRSWQGTLYLHNGKCFQMSSCPSYKCSMNKINFPTGAIGSWSQLATVVSPDGYFVWDFFEDYFQEALLKKFSKKLSMLPGAIEWDVKSRS